MKKCKVCKEKFTPRFHSLQPTCENPSCILEYKRLKERKEAKEDVKRIKEKNRSQDFGWHIQKLQRIFNAYIRLRDKDEPCISCGVTSGVQWSAGHFFTAGSFPNLRVNEDNVHKQCWYNCNKNKSGNLAEYRPRLIQKIGEERFAALEAAKNIPFKPSIPEVQAMIRHYEAKIKEMQRK